MDFLSLKTSLFCALHKALIEAEETPFKQAPKSSSQQGHWADNRLPLAKITAWVKGLNPSDLISQIPLEKKLAKPGSATDILYISALPQKLAKCLRAENSLPLIQFSKHFANWLNQVHFEGANSEQDHHFKNLPLSLQLWGNFEIETQRPGWVGFQLSDAGIALWLKQIERWGTQQSLSRFDQPQPLPTFELTFPFSSSVHQASDTKVAASGHPANLSHQLSAAKIASPSASQAARAASQEARWLWQAQYTHARCCSLLRLWHRLSLAQLSLAHPSRPCSTKPMPFLSSHLAGPSGVPWLTPNLRLRVSSPTARELIVKLSDVGDDLFWIPYRKPHQQYFLLLKSAAQLCQGFERFYQRDLSGFGQVFAGAEPKNILQVQARMGLVNVTRLLLNRLLSKGLGVFAPDEL